jgi:pyruvate kinase
MRSRLRHGPPNTAADAIASVVETALDVVPCAAAFVPTRTGTTARMISRLSPPLWIVGLCEDPAVCQGLTFSYGVEPVHLIEDPENWRDFARAWLDEHQIPGSIALLAAGPSPRHPDANYRLEFLKIGEFPADTSISDLVSQRYASWFTQSDEVVQ